MGGAQAAEVLKDADCYAVAVLSEALEVRAAAPDKEILVLGYVSPDGFAEAIWHNISLTMYRPEALEALDRQAAAMGQRARVHIKINSGMNRIGFCPYRRKRRCCCSLYEIAILRNNRYFYSSGYSG